MSGRKYSLQFDVDGGAGCATGGTTYWLNGDRMPWIGPAVDRAVLRALLAHAMSHLEETRSTQDGAT
jgi:hypothetical protein